MNTSVSFFIACQKLLFFTTMRYIIVTTRARAVDLYKP